MNKTNNIRVRIAPSPTGFFHIGTARTALFNWLFARKHGGAFIVRIEDTDRERSKAEFEVDITESLEWLGLVPDEFYRQSERTEIYKKYLEKLLKERKAFYCAHSIEELEQESERQKKAGQVPCHLCDDRDARITEGIIRFKNNETDAIIIGDLIRGEIRFDPRLIGDFALARNLEEPLYNFANTVDDRKMDMSHVIRGEDHISNTPKQILVGRALGFTQPRWTHVPLLLGSDRSKLSKRHGALAVREYRAQGYLPEAMLNFVALLGWHPPAGKRGEREREVFSRDELIELFSLERIQKAGAIAEMQKLDWFNREYLKKLSDKEFIDRAAPFISSPEGKRVPKELLPIFKKRITRLSDVDQEIRSIINLSDYEAGVLLKGDREGAHVCMIIDTILNILSRIDPQKFSGVTAREALDPLVKKEGIGSVLWPLRASLSGKEVSIGPFELVDILEKDEVVRRLIVARNKL